MNAKFLIAKPLAGWRKAAPGIGALVAAAVVVTTPVPSLAQDDSEARLRRAEAEIRALQRAVFPGGDGRFFEPQITADGTATGPTRSTAPSTTAVTDILARLDAIELQLQRLTALSEENTNSLALMEERVAALEARPIAPVAPIEEPDAQAAAEQFGEDPAEDQANAQQPEEELGAAESNLAAMTGAAQEAEAPAVTGPSPERLAAVQEITKPQSDDAGDDEYSYGFRLWNAGFFPEARQQLASYVEGYPDHYRITYGRNLLGRAFLDDGMPEEAARWFLRNYQADRTARRAPDSLLFLAEAMIAMDDTTRACIALAEFAETYPAVATGRLADQYQSNRRKVTCA
ncbi:MAG: hypothetical protein AAF697_06365 [Pseudomonadota bacterium]